MEPLELIVTALAAGAAAAQKPAVEQSVIKAYEALKALIKKNYSDVDIEILEKHPQSENRRGVVQEDLKDANAGEDEALLQAVETLLGALQDSDPKAIEAIGVDIEKLRAAQDVIIQDVSVKGKDKAIGVKGSDWEIDGTLEIGGVDATAGEEGNAVGGAGTSTSAAINPKQSTKPASTLSAMYGEDLEQFNTVLINAFSYKELERLLRYRLDKRLDTITLADDYTSVVFEVTTASQRHGWIMGLLLAAQETNPGNLALLAFGQRFGLAPGNLPEFKRTVPAAGALPANSELESIINKSNSALDVMPWLEKLTAITGQVCRVEIKGRAKGTGFLVGPDVVMTNYHVLQSVLDAKQEDKPQDVRCRFDYKVLSNGQELNPGVTYSLAHDIWLLDASPYSAVDTKSHPKPSLPQADELDYALVRLVDSPGNKGIGKKPASGDKSRGWIPYQGLQHDFEPNSPLYIVQHPAGEPLSLVLESRAVITVNGNRTRVTYRTNTEPGSSGSPVFDQNWNLVALHHAGDPEDKDFFDSNGNEGIPFDAILALLQERDAAGNLEV